MATAEELLSGLTTVDKTLVISNDLRTISIPSSVPNLGVESDNDVLRLNFKMPRHIGDIDLSTFGIRINYLNAGGETDVYTVSDAEPGTDHISFSWLVGPTATRYKGETTFNVCLITLDSDGYVDQEFNTTIARLKVLEGLEVDESLVEQYSDLIEQWRKELFGTGKASDADRTKADAIVCSAQGEVIHLYDSSDDYLRGLKIFGHTSRFPDGATPTPDNPRGLVPVEIYGVDIMRQDYGEDDQYFAITDHNILHGVPVSSGGNYTDSLGQQWVCDEIDFERGVYVQRVGMLTLNGSENWTLDTVLSGYYRYVCGEVGKIYGGLMHLPGMNTHFKQSLSPGTGYEYLYLRQDDDGGTAYISSNKFGTVDALKTWLNKNNVSVIYKLPTPIETPLSANQIAEFKKLHTHYPYTTVSNAAGAWMKVRYNVDTKIWNTNSFMPIDERDFGHNNTISAKGYYITEVDANEKSITLSMKQNVTDTAGLDLTQWYVGDELSFKNNSDWSGRACKITSKSGNKIFVDTFPEKLSSLSSGSNLDFDERSIFATHTTFKSDMPWFIDKVYLRSGQIEFARFAATFGYNNALHTKGGIQFGSNNQMLPSGGNSFNLGSKGIVTASNAGTLNYNNQVTADNGTATGMSTSVSAIAGFSSGYQTRVRAKYGAAFGQETEVNMPSAATFGVRTVANCIAQLVCGQDNLGDDFYDKNAYFVVGCGTKDNKATALRVLKATSKTEISLDMVKHKIVNLADGVAYTDACTVGQLKALLSRIEELEKQVAELKA